MHCCNCLKVRIRVRYWRESIVDARGCCVLPFQEKKLKVSEIKEGVEINNRSVWKQPSSDYELNETLLLWFKLYRNANVSMNWTVLYRRKVTEFVFNGFRRLTTCLMLGLSSAWKFMNEAVAVIKKNMRHSCIKKHRRFVFLYFTVILKENNIKL